MVDQRSEAPKERYRTNIRKEGEMTIKRSDLKEILTNKSQETEIAAIEKIIDGNLLRLEEFPDPDHPDRTKNRVVVDFDGPIPTPEINAALKAKYKKAGWNLIFSIGNNGPCIILSYKESLDKRKQNIRKRFENEDYGHKLAPWEKIEGGDWFARCTNPRCRLEFFLNSRDPHAGIFVGELPIQGPVSCPCHSLYPYRP